MTKKIINVVGVLFLIYVSFVGCTTASVMILDKSLEKTDSKDLFPN